MISASNRFDSKWKLVTSDILVCKSCGRYYDGMPDGSLKPTCKRCKCGSFGLLEADLAEVLRILNGKH